MAIVYTELCYDLKIRENELLNIFFLLNFNSVKTQSNEMFVQPVFQGIGSLRTETVLRLGHQ